ncbi:Sialidase [Xylariaceae sp. FL0804]|nr:Sialidase [Xylariaceae sp. FL0804]
MLFRTMLLNTLGGLSMVAARYLDQRALMRSPPAISGAEVPVPAAAEGDEKTCRRDHQSHHDADTPTTSLQTPPPSPPPPPIPPIQDPEDDTVTDSTQPAEPRPSSPSSSVADAPSTTLTPPSLPPPPPFPPPPPPPPPQDAESDASPLGGTSSVRAPSMSYSLSAGEVSLAAAGGYPRLARLPDGSLLAASTRRNDDVQVISVTRSDDGGATFAPLGEVVRGRRDGSKDVDNGFLLPLGDGRILCAYRDHDLDLDPPNDDAEPDYAFYRITVSHSEDGGRSWAELSQAAGQRANRRRRDGAAAPPKLNGLWEPFLRLARDGRTVQLLYSGELAADDQETFAAESRDGGRTWSAPRNLGLHSSSSAGGVEGLEERRRRQRDGMVGIAPFRGADGAEALMMVFETTTTPSSQAEGGGNGGGGGGDGNGRASHFRIEYVVSRDDGATWGERGVVYDPPTGNAGAPQAAPLGDEVAVVFGTDRDAVPHAGLWNSLADVVVVVTSGLGRAERRQGDGDGDGVGIRFGPGDGPVLVSSRPSEWPAVYALDEGTVMAVYGRDGAPRGKLLRLADA